MSPFDFNQFVAFLVITLVLCFVFIVAIKGFYGVLPK